MRYADTVEDEDILDTVAAALADDEADALAGGVDPSTVAERMGVSTNAAVENMVRLAEWGDLRRVDGINPETLQPRTSYLPTEADR